MRLASPHRRLHLYVGAVGALGVLAGLVVLADPGSPWLPRSPAVVIVLGVAAVIGELQPLRISRSDGSVDELTMSDCFVLALVLGGPLTVALAVQAGATLLDDVRRRKPPVKVAFNLGQYMLTAWAARLVFVVVAHVPLLASPGPFGPTRLAGGLLAAATFYVVNNLLISVVIALSGHEPVGRAVLSDLRADLGAGAVVLALAPAVLQAVEFSVWLAPLLLLPITAVHKNAQLAIQRRQQAMHDSLTGLANRELLRQRASAELALAAPEREPLAVMLIDLDHFKEINDTLGHHVGDQLLKLVAARLHAAMRDHDTVARLGGDEFAVLVPGVGGATGAHAVAARLADSLNDAFELDGVRVHVAASIGIALAPQHGAEVDGLLQRADVALYAAKERRGTVQMYSPDDDGHTIERLSMLGELREGLSRGEIVVHYQPKAEARTGRILGVEALARWEHPLRGLLAPDEFIPVAENTGLIGALTLEILRQSLAQVAAWRAVGLDLGVAVNLSARHLGDVDLPRHVAAALQSAGVPASRLTLEVTESTIMADKSRAAAVLGALRQLGVHLAIDDFGTGYSSLAYLTRLPIDELKIDKSFVLGLDGDAANEVIVHSTIELGHNLGLRVVAEGVEDDRLWQRLSGLGCDLVQGFRLSAPLPPALLEHRLRAVPVPPATLTLDDAPATVAEELPTG